MQNKIRLHESLVESIKRNADHMRLLSKELCVGDFLNSEACAWYHGIWEYLRALDMVSTPEWHHTFYNDMLTEKLNGSTSRILISGTADHSMLAYIIYVCQLKGIRPLITILDLCKTVLKVNEEYAMSKGFSVNCLQEDILEVDTKIHKFDIICTDAFLTRFPRDLSIKVVEKWHSLLLEGGKVLTTIRVHGLYNFTEEENAKKRFLESALSRYDEIRSFSSIEYSTYYSMVEEYMQRITSNDLGDEIEIKEMFLLSGFEVDTAELVSVKGEFFPTDYIELFAIRRNLWANL